MGRPYQINEGDGVFYGPKIDFYVMDALKRKHQLSTIQLDFNMPERFRLKYVDKDNTLKQPIMIHRAVLGSLERFIGVLIEHVAGVFPFWLAPVQARIIPITDDHADYGRDFMNELIGLGMRAEIDDRNESMGLKTRDAQKSKILFSLVAGDREKESGTFSVRKYGEKTSEVMKKEEIIAAFQKLNDVPNQVL